MNPVRPGSRPPTRRAWVALAIPPAAWYVFEVGLASVLKVDCAPVSAGLGLAWGGGSLLACAAAAALAWPMARQDGGVAPSRRWLARVAVMLAAVFALAIFFQTVGVLIVPACVR
jgi:hypothetical protein